MTTYDGKAGRQASGLAASRHRSGRNLEAVAQVEPASTTPAPSLPDAPARRRRPVRVRRSPDGQADDHQVAAWVEAAQGGDREAFQELVAASYRDVFTLALRLCRSEDDALDVTQEAYLRAYRSLDKFRGDSKFSTWVYRITANCASSYLKKRSRHRHEELDEHREPADAEPSRDPVGRAESTELRARLDEALGTLAPKLRAVVVLRDIYDLPHDDIASELGISVSASKVRLHRARHQLRDELLPDIAVGSRDL